MAEHGKKNLQAYTKTLSAQKMGSLACANGLKRGRAQGNKQESELPWVCGGTGALINTIRRVIKPATR